MESFIKKNDIGIPFNCCVVANFNYSGEDYVIYTDFVNDADGGLRLFSAKKMNGSIFDIDETLSGTIISLFKKEESTMVRNKLEMIK